MSRSRVLAGVLAGVLAAVVLLALAGCAPAPGNVSNEQFKQLQADGVRIIDVRTPAEFESGYIEGAENVPIDELAVTAESWDRTEPIALYCATGNRSADGMQTLQKMGFEEVYNLTEGIAGWDGDTVGGSESAGGTTDPSVSGLPVMYEFYTDW